MVYDTVCEGTGHHGQGCHLALVDDGPDYECKNLKTILVGLSNRKHIARDANLPRLQVQRPHEIIDASHPLTTMELAAPVKLPPSTTKQSKLPLLQFAHPLRAHVPTREATSWTSGSEGSSMARPMPAPSNRRTEIVHCKTLIFPSSSKIMPFLR
jgi:hypothetical protein